MKPKVIIENSETSIILTPENEFERDILEKIHSKKDNFNTLTYVDAKYELHGYGQHKLIINIKEDK